jgi:hypothetical protein
VKLLHHGHINVGETYFMGEELHEILQNRSNEDYINDKYLVSRNFSRICKACLETGGQYSTL